MNGTLPDSFYNLTKLKQISLSGNSFSGQLQTGIGNFVDLVSLKISRNRFSGTLPPALGLCKKLGEQFGKSFCTLEALLTDLFICIVTCSELIQIQDNDIVGSAPAEVCALRDKRVFQADCSPEDGVPFFDCDTDCCTTCCAHESRSCLGYEYSAVDVSSDRYVMSGIPEELERTALKRNASFSTLPDSDPRLQALNWILHTDELQLNFTDQDLSQRYTLALMVYQLDYTVWFNDPDLNATDDATSGDIIDWLSPTDACDWFGVTCVDGLVTEIDLCE